MGSETGAKWFGVILLYFALMTFIVALIGQTADTTIGNSENTTGTYCGGPRNIYEPYIGGPKDLTDVGSVWSNYYGGQIDCSLSVGVLGQTTCESISGCTWSSPMFLWWSTGDDTCAGDINYSFITPSASFLGTIIEDYTDLSGDTTNFICGQTDVRTNETLCNALSCTWEYRTGVEDFNGDVIEPKLSMLSSIWDVAKDMVTFRFDFGFDNALANTLLYFLVFWLPLIGLGLSIYVMVRS